MGIERKNGIDGSVKYTPSGGGAEVNIPIKAWECTKAVPAADATTNADAGFDNVTAGNKKMTGTVSCLWDAALEPEADPVQLSEGDQVILHLYPTKEGGYFEVPALITEVPVSCRENETVAWTFSFTNRGAYSWVPAA